VRACGFFAWVVGNLFWVALRGGDGEPVRDGDVWVLLGDGGGGGEECGEWYAK